MTKLFLDTNIVIDLLDRREPYTFCATGGQTLCCQFWHRRVRLLVPPFI